MSKGDRESDVPSRTLSTSTPRGGLPPYLALSDLILNVVGLGVPTIETGTRQRLQIVQVFICLDP